MVSLVSLVVHRPVRCHIGLLGTYLPVCDHANFSFSQGYLDNCPEEEEPYVSFYFCQLILTTRSPLSITLPQIVHLHKHLVHIRDTCGFPIAFPWLKHKCHYNIPQSGA